MSKEISSSQRQGKRPSVVVDNDGNQIEMEDVHINEEADAGGFASTSEDTDESSADAKVLITRRRKRLVLCAIFCAAVVGLAIVAAGVAVGTSFFVGSSQSQSQSADDSAPVAPPAAPPVAATGAPTGAPAEAEVPATPSPVAATLPPVAAAEPTMAPASPTQPPSFGGPTETTFCVVADVPYFDIESRELSGQLATQMDGCEFVVHLGDIMAGDVPCTEDRFEHVKELMSASTVPALFIVGDNEWNDCGTTAQINDAWVLWQKHLMNFHDNWQHDLDINRQLSHEENYYFIRSRTLFFGINLVGGLVHNLAEWNNRLSDTAAWIQDVIREKTTSEASGVIILGHARPTNDHKRFFEPMAEFMRDELRNSIPMLYLHGDGHSYTYSNSFFGQNNWIGVQHEGGTRHPILKITSDPTNDIVARKAFKFDRQMDLVR